MLHLTVIGIVCAVSAPSEGTSLIRRKHNESNIFCHFDEGQQNVAKVSLPSVDNVDVHNSSNCAKQKVTNRTSSFFYDRINKQYQNSKNSSCSIMENVFLEKKKKLHTNVGFVFKKRSLLWTKEKEKLVLKMPTPRTKIANCQALRPVRKCKRKKCKIKNYKRNMCKMKHAGIMMQNPIKINNECASNCHHKKTFLRSVNKNSEKPTLKKKHLDTVKVNDELDINKRIDKIVKEVALENQRKEDSKGFGDSVIKDDKQSQIIGSNDKQKAEDSFSLIGLIKKIFSFSKDHFNSKKCDANSAVNSKPVKNEDGKYSIAEKASGPISSSDFKGTKKITRFKRNPYSSYSYFDNPIPLHRNNFIERPHLYNNDFIAKRPFLYPPIVKKVFPRRVRRRRRFPKLRSRFYKPYKYWGHEPFLRKFNFGKQNNYDPRLKRNEKTTDESREVSKTQEDDSIFTSSSTDGEISDTTEKTYESSMTTIEQTTEETTENISTAEDDFKTTVDPTLSTLNLSENFSESTTENFIELTTGGKEGVQKQEGVLLDHTLEKPFLKRDFKHERFENYRPNSDFDTYENNFIMFTDSPLIGRNRFRKSQRYKYESMNNDNLNPYRFLKIRHALRNYLIHNNVLGLSKRNLSFGRKKRCGGKACPLGRKCWRSAPLLCVPYIKKGQDDVLRYLIGVMQQMMGKKFPPKVDIFEKTKYKPCARRESNHPCECPPEERLFEYASPNEQSFPEMSSPPMAPYSPAMPPCPPAMPPCPPAMAPCSPAMAPCSPAMAPCSPAIPPCPMALPPCPVPSTPCHYSNCPIVSRTCLAPPLPYAAKFNPEILRPSYTNLNVPRQYPCPAPNSWPSEVPFYVPRVDQMVPQNSAPYICPGKVPVFTYQNTAPTSTLTTTSSRPPAILTNNVNSEVNSSPASVIKTTVSERITTSDVSVTATSNSPNPSVPHSNVLPSQFASTTVVAMEVAEPKVNANIKDSSSSSTKSACALYVSSSPIGQEEYFSYTAVPYKAHECSTHASQYAETAPSVPLNQEMINSPPNENPMNPQKMHYETGYPKVENTSPNIQQNMQWPATASVMPPPQDTTFYQSRVKEMSRNIKLDAPPQLNPSQYNQIRKEDRNRRFEGNKNFRKNIGKTLLYEDYPLSERQMQSSEINYENPQKRFFRMKHRRIQNPNIKSSEYLTPYDYYFFEKYPQMKPQDANSFKYGRYSLPGVLWKDYGRKIRTFKEPNSLVRRKRGDDYYFERDNLDGLDNYMDYFDDSNYNDDELNKHSETKSKMPDKYFYNFAWTPPPTYDMFSELAKAVSDFNYTTSSFEITTNHFNLKDSFSDSLDQSETVPTLQVSKYDEFPVTNTKFYIEEDLNTPVTNLRLTPSPSALPEAEEVDFTQFVTTTASELEDNDQEITTDSKKFGKPSFFQMNSKAMQTSRNSRKNEVKGENKLDENQDLESADQCQIPTTLKTANIVKGQKKSMTKPSPKGYSKIFPDSFEADVTEALAISTSGTTAKAYMENKSALLASTTKPDVRLQLLAVCEGYLEVVKLIKSQNQTLGEDLDENLAQYCESVISQSFNSQLEKPKKPEGSESLSQSATKEGEVVKNQSKSTSQLTQLASGLISHNNPTKELFEAQPQEKVVADILKNSSYNKDVQEKKNETSEVTVTNNKNTNNNNDDDNNDDDEDDNNNDDDDDDDNNDQVIAEWTTTTETAKSLEATELRIKTKKKKKERNSERLLANIRIKKLKKRRKKEEIKENSLKRGMSKDQSELIELIKKREKALLSWLFNSKNQENSDKSQETEYFDDEDLMMQETEPPLNSGTIKPKRDEKRSGKTKNYLTFVNASIFPVYAKQYGYDKGGELREVEVLWRKINEKTHEERILKNLSVLALLMPLTNPPSLNHQEIKLVGNNGLENDDLPETEMKRESKLSLGDAELGEISEETYSPTLIFPETTEANDISTTQSAGMSTKPMQKSATYIFINKPDPISIVGASLNVTTVRPNTTRKTSHKMEVAKDIFQEYTIEFLNYAVYILPIMLTIIFLFCCLCCGLHILKTQQSLKKYRKKKKTFSTDDTSDTTEESGRHSKKRKREARCKRKTSEVLMDQKGPRKFWNVLKLPSRASKQFDEKSRQPERKKTILRFLTDDGEKKSRESDEHSHGVRRKKRDDDCHKSDDHTEAAERRELIALLEELKKIETEHTEEKKEVKSVHVQYMTQEDDNSVFQSPDVLYPYQKNVFGMPKGYSFYSKPFPCRPKDPAAVKDYELYEDVHELTELLPCECSYFSKKNDYWRHCDFRINQPGRCERFFKIFRDSSVSRHGPFREKNFMKNESENRSFIFNKYRSISTDTSEELMGVTQKNAGTEVKFTDIAPPFTLPNQKNAGLVEEVDDLKCQLNNNKKYVRLKDDGVLCRL